MADKDAFSVPSWDGSAKSRRRYTREVMVLQGYAHLQAAICRYQVAESPDGTSKAACHVMERHGPG